MLAGSASVPRVSGLPGPGALAEGRARRTGCDPELESGCPGRGAREHLGLANLNITRLRKVRESAGRQVHRDSSFSAGCGGRVLEPLPLIRKFVTETERARERVRRRVSEPRLDRGEGDQRGGDVVPIAPAFLDGV